MSPAPRRRWPVVLAVALVLPVLLLVTGGAFVGFQYATAITDTAGEVDFERPLAIPPLADSTVDGTGRRVFDLDVRPGTTDFGMGGPAETWGVNGSYLGPTLRASRDESVRVDVRNGLDVTTTMHWHGMHLPAEMDGGPHQPIAPGSTWSPEWTVDQPAATLWYHPHLLGETAEHIWRGVAGMMILDDPAVRHPDGTGLPQRYGVDDVPVIVQDRSFSSDGDFSTRGSLLSSTGRLGDTVLVNGTVGPYLDVTTSAVRLRLLNASNARVYDFGFDDDRTFTMVGSDGGLLPAPVELRRVRVSPGERAEVVVALTPGEDTVLRSYPPGLGRGGDTDRFSGGADTLDVLQLRAADTLRPSLLLPEVLAPAPDLLESEATGQRSFALGGNSINGESMRHSHDEMDHSRIDEVVTLGETEVWSVHNTGDAPHSFHVHDVQFQVLDVDGDDPGPLLSGWKDTVFVERGSTIRFLVRFSDYADPDTPYMFHCHVLLHEDEGMMGQFVVVDPDDG